MATNWLEISTQVDTEGVEAVAEVFRRYVYGGVSIEQEIDPFEEGDGYAPRVDSPVVIKGYIPVDADAEPKVARIEEALWHLNLLRPIQPLSSRVVCEDDWKDAWKKFFHVNRLGKRVVIKPSWCEYAPQPDDLIVEIDPGMAFGTGLHPTTQMCIAEIEKNVQPGQVVLDLGTGSGILSILAARMGAGKVLALDVDSVAVDAARSNVELNGLQDIVRVELGSLYPSTATPGDQEDDSPGERNGFDVVVANIIAKVIVELSHPIAAAIRPSGIVIASGIIDEKRAWVEESLMAAGLEIASEVHAGDWVTLVGRKPRR